MSAAAATVTLFFKLGFDKIETSNFSGSEFLLVLAVIDLQDFKYEYLYSINMAITRGQYELGFLLSNALRNSLDLNNYLAKRQTTFAQSFEDFIAGRALTSDWLTPTDLDRFQFLWWQKKIEDSPTEYKKNKSQDVQNPESGNLPSNCRVYASTFPNYMIFSRKMVI